VFGEPGNHSLELRPIVIAWYFCYLGPMCRNIRPLFNFDPPVTESEIRAAAVQFVRKISGFTKPSKLNEVAFQHAVDEIASIAAGLITSLETTAPPRNRETENAKAKARSLRRFAT